MTTNAFIDILNSPSSISAQDVRLLKELVNRYPYFSLAQLLYLKGLYLHGDPVFGEVASRGAVYAQSSEWLYQFLKHAEAVREFHVEASEERNISNPEISTEVVTAENVEEVYVNAAAEKASASIDMPDSSEIQAAISAGIKNETSEEEMFELLGDEELAVADPILEVLDQKLYTLEDAENTLEVQNSLIDQFLSLNPRIVPKPDLPPVNEDISVSSLEDDGELVSEMLAKIYATQGLIDKAIEVYQKLCLKYPEKRAYFVAELEKIQK